MEEYQIMEDYQDLLLMERAQAIKANNQTKKIVKVDSLAMKM